MGQAYFFCLLDVPIRDCNREYWQIISLTRYKKIQPTSFQIIGDCSVKRLLEKRAICANTFHPALEAVSDT